MLLRHASAEIDGFKQEDDHEKQLDEKGKVDCVNLSIAILKDSGSNQILSFASDGLISLPSGK